MLILLPKTLSSSEKSSEFLSKPLPEKELPFFCGNENNSQFIPDEAKSFIHLDRNREMQYDIGLAFHIIYGEYALTDITLHLTINEYYETV